MRNLTAASAIALIGSSMLAGTAAGDPDRMRGACRFLEKRVDQCEGGARLSLETRAACDRFEWGFRDLGPAGLSPSPMPRQTTPAGSIV